MAISAEEFSRRCRTFHGVFELASFAEPKEKIVDEIGDSVATNFATQLNPNGMRFPPRKQNYRHPMLIKTGKMFLAQTTRGAAGNRVVIERRSVAMSVDDNVVPYMKFHHKGSGRLPMRRTFYLRRQDTGRVKGRLRSHARLLFVRNHNGI